MINSAQTYFSNWLKVIEEDELERLIPVLRKTYSNRICYPNYKSIFKVFNITPYEKLKCVFLIQNPYPNKLATGIALGIPEGSEKLTPELALIKDAVIDYTNPNCTNQLFDYTLESWCKQGILLLNTSLTVETGKPGSHNNIWLRFMIKLIKNISLKNNGLVWVIIGNDIKYFKKYIYNGIIFERPSLNYYIKNNLSLDPELFIDIKNTIKSHYNEDIKFYEEINTFEE